MSSQHQPLSASEYALLGFLLAGPSHGYELHKKFSESSSVGMIWGVKIANMYAQLEKLERRGLISGRLQESDQRPARTQYSLTPQGEEEFNSWLHEPVHHPRDFRHDFFVRLFFIARYQPDELTALVERQIEICSSWQRDLMDKPDELPQSGNFADMVNYFRHSQIQSMLDWLTWLKTQIPLFSTLRGEQ